MMKGGGRCEGEVRGEVKYIRMDLSFLFLHFNIGSNEVYSNKL